MRPRTAVATASVLLVLVGVVVVGLGGDLGPAAGGELAERWVSDTPRENQLNHHGVGADDGGVVVVPVAAVPGTEELTDASCSLVRLGADTGEVQWRYSVPPEECFVHALTAPAVADLDADGRPEVAVATAENALVGLDAAAGEETFRVPLSAYGYSRPVVANLTPGPGREVVVSDIAGDLVAVAGDGSVRWRVDLNATVWASPVVEDVTGDGRPDVLVTTADGTVLLDSTGEVVWRADESGTDVVVRRGGDDDRASEVFVTDVRTVTALDGASGDVEWRRSLDTRARLETVRDGDGDGRAELYVGLVSQHVLALDARTGEREWATRLVAEERPTVPAPVVGDVGGDDAPEVVGVATDGTVAVLDPDTGEELAAYERRVPAWTAPTLADVDGDGDAEILVRYGDGRVVALSYEE